jgi:hypothetical protein
MRCAGVMTDRRAAKKNEDKVGYTMPYGGAAQRRFRTPSASAGTRQFGRTSAPMVPHLVIPSSGRLCHSPTPSAATRHRAALRSAGDERVFAEGRRWGQVHWAMLPAVDLSSRVWLGKQAL